MTAPADLEGLLARVEGASPIRVQLSRAKGWRMPPNTVKVDRTTRWGNHIVVGEPRGIGFRPWTAEDAVEQFRTDIENETRTDRPDGTEPLDLTPLRGKNLACWCRPGSPCHADVLLELANAPLSAQSASPAERSDRAQDERSNGKVE